MVQRVERRKGGTGMGLDRRISRLERSPMTSEEMEGMCDPERLARIARILVEAEALEELFERLHPELWPWLTAVIGEGRQDAKAN